MSGIDNQGALEHAWRYFELHAGQRLSSFNYFIVVSGLILSGLGACLTSGQVRYVGAFLGVLLAITSVVFYFLDARTSFLIKHAEEGIVALEAHAPSAGQIFTSERAKTDAKWMPTYGLCFRVTFVLFGLVGVMGAVFCAVVK